MYGHSNVIDKRTRQQADRHGKRNGGYWRRAFPGEVITTLPFAGKAFTGFVREVISVEVVGLPPSLITTRTHESESGVRLTVDAICRDYCGSCTPPEQLLFLLSFCFPFYQSSTTRARSLTVLPILPV